MYFGSPTTATLALIPDGRAGTFATLRIMAGLAREGSKSMQVRERSLSLTQSCGQKDFACEAAQLHRFVRDSIRYVQDVADVETVQTAEKTLEYRAGDCDDKAVLLSALLLAVGHPARFVAIGFEPGIYSHVFVETKIGARWIPLETTEPVEMGWSAPGAVERKNWFI